MSTLPPWIDDRIDRNFDRALTQEHVVETMLDSDRPFFSIRELQARIKPDVSDATVRNRLGELQALGIVATETYPDAVTLYYVDYPESEWPLSPADHRALTAASPLDRLTARGFLTMSDTTGIRTLVLAGLQFGLLLFAVGAVLTVAGVDVSSTGSDFVFWDTAFDLVFVSLAIYGIERAVRWYRHRDGSLTDR